MTIADDQGNTYTDLQDFHTQYQVAQNTKTQKAVSDVLEGYHVSPAFKQGIFYNIGAESGWNQYERHEDQPRFGGEAHYSHGLYQEGGGDTRPLFDYAIRQNKQWTDPEVQTRYVFEQNPLGRQFLEKYGQSQDWREVAAGFATDYLKPKDINLQHRIRDIYGQQQPPLIHVTKYPDYQNAVIGHDHDVPLIAGALMDNSGKFIGSDFDRRVARYANIEGHTVDMFEGVHHHEMAEVKEMEENLLPSGMKSAQAYKQAHEQVATPAEKKWAENKAKELGVDPAKFWSSYQQHWTDALKKTSEQPPEKVNPHLYLHPYDGHEHQAVMEKLSGRTIADHPTQTAAKEYLPRKPEGYPTQKSNRVKGYLASNLPEDVDQKRAKEMDELSKGLQKDKDPFGGLLDLLNEDLDEPLPPKASLDRTIKQHANDLREVGITLVGGIPKKKEKEYRTLTPEEMWEQGAPGTPLGGYPESNAPRLDKSMDRLKGESKYYDSDLLPGKPGRSTMDWNEITPRQMMIMNEPKDIESIRKVHP